MTVAKNIFNSPRSASFKMRICEKYATHKIVGKTFVRYSFDDNSSLTMQKCSRNLGAINFFHSSVDSAALLG